MTDTDDRDDTERDLAALQTRYGPPQPRLPQRGQLPLGLEG